MISGLLFFLERPIVGNSPKSPTATRSRFGPIPEQGPAKPGARPRRTGGLRQIESLLARMLLSMAHTLGFPSVVNESIDHHSMLRAFKSS